MSLVGFKAQNHPQQKARPDVDDRQTPPELFHPISERLGGFTIDVAASERNRKTPRFYSVVDDGLAKSWAGERVWCNPPYSSIRPWVAKAWESHRLTELIAMLLPANRCEQAWWQDLVEPFRDRPGSPLSVEFISQRQRFIRANATAVGPNERPPFGCCLLVWKSIEPTTDPMTLRLRA